MVDAGAEIFLFVGLKYCKCVTMGTWGKGITKREKGNGYLFGEFRRREKEDVGCDEENGLWLDDWGRAVTGVGRF